MHVWPKTTELNMKKSSIALNEKYGRLIPIKISGKQNGHTMFECICECGKMANVKGIHLKNGHTKSCGCYDSEATTKRNLLPPGESSFNYLYSYYTRNATKRNLKFSLTKEEFRLFTQMNCFYCRKPPAMRAKRDSTGKTNGHYIHNGIDRLDSNIGYMLDNCVPCCKICNRAKCSMALQEYLDWIEGIRKGY